MSKESALAVATGTAPVVDAPKVEVAAGAEAPKDELVSSRIAQIARKEAKYREEQERFKGERESLLKSKTEFEPFYQKYKEFEAMKSKDPVAAIKLLGFSDTDYVNFVAAQEDKSTPEERAAKIAEEKIAEFKTEQETKAQAEESRRNEESINQFKKNIGITVKTDPDRFEMCAYYGEAAEALIFKTVQECYQNDLKTNPDAEPLTAEKAAEMVESYYEEFHQNANKLKKFQPKDTIKEEVVVKKDEPLKAEVVTPQKPLPPPAVSRTLTNKVTPPVTSTAKKPESRGEKRERLMRALAEGRAP